MGKQLTYYIVDVFSGERFAGNQLAVFTNAGHLGRETMQRLANEMHFSESTFILDEYPGDSGYPVKIFTPEREVPFAGHPTLGTGYVINQFLRDKPSHTIHLNLEVGSIPVTFDAANDLCWMKQNAPEFEDEIPGPELTKLLSLTPADLDGKYPAQIVSTGLPFVILPLNSLDATGRSRVDPRYYPGILENMSTQSILVFSRETLEDGNDLHARVFAESYGVPEDPATGSANGCLAAYLATYTYFGSKKIDIRVEQGYELGRPSTLHLKTAVDAGEIQVFVGGSVIPVAKGELL